MIANMLLRPRLFASSLNSLSLSHIARSLTLGIINIISIPIDLESNGQPVDVYSAGCFAIRCPNWATPFVFFESYRRRIPPFNLDMEKDKVYPWVIRLPILYGDDKSLHRLCCSTPSPPCSLWLRVYTRPLRGLDAFHKGILVTLDLLTWNGPNGPTAGSGRARSAAAGTFVDPPLSALKTSLLVLDIEATLDVALYYPPGPSQKKVPSLHMYQQLVTQFSQLHGRYFFLPSAH